jgi:hypothetical protein
MRRKLLAQKRIEGDALPFLAAGQQPLHPRQRREPVIDFGSKVAIAYLTNPS